MPATGLGPALIREGDSPAAIRLGGWALILGALAFLVVFAVLAARFDYPAILAGPADLVLPRLLATGTAGRAVWAVYALLPLIWIPAGGEPITRSAAPTRGRCSSRCRRRCGPRSA